MCLDSNKDKIVKNVCNLMVMIGVIYIDYIIVIVINM